MLLSSNPPECQVWGKGGGDQANLYNAKILRAYGQVTPPLIVLVTLRIKHVISSKPHPETIHPIRPSTYSSRCALRLRQHFLRTQVYVVYESFFFSVSCDLNIIWTKKDTPVTRWYSLTFKTAFFQLQGPFSWGGKWLPQREKLPPNFRLASPHSGLAANQGLSFPQIV